MRIPFTKMQGLGNDFIVLNCLEKSIPQLAEKASGLCDRRFGIGCDQLLVALPSGSADLKMQIFNADGSEVEMCGNGIRCFALFAKKHGLVKTDAMTVETLAGIIKPRIEGDLVEVDMGEPVLEGGQIPVNFEGKVIRKKIEVKEKEYEITCVSMGNPHCILFIEDAEKAPLTTLGPILERHPLFPKRINVEFVEVVDKSTLKVRVWERGAGVTLACGTGACASAVAAVLNGHASRNVTVQLPGGNLAIHWSESDNHVYMKGPGVEVFTGEIEI